MPKMSATQIEAIEVANSYLNNAGLQTIQQLLGKQADAVEKALRPVIQIEVRSVYGVLQSYPANEAAKLLAQIAGTKTLKHETLALAERMGFSIEQISQQQFYKVAA